MVIISCEPCKSWDGRECKGYRVIVPSLLQTLFHPSFFNTVSILLYHIFSFINSNYEEREGMWKKSIEFMGYEDEQQEQTGGYKKLLSRCCRQETVNVWPQPWGREGGRVEQLGTAVQRIKQLPCQCQSNGTWGQSRWKGKGSILCNTLWKNSRCCWIEVAAETSPSRARLRSLPLEHNGAICLQELS